MHISKKYIFNLILKIKLRTKSHSKIFSVESEAKNRNGLLIYYIHL